MIKLPFSGYSWPFTQHAIALEAETLYYTLACASCFQGEESPGQQITQLMIQNELLTENIRDGRADAWRDYQQVLAEVGLIYSTTVIRQLTLTRAGNMLLSGEVGFSELMTIQALRYQYPNGQKTTIQSRLRQTLEGEGIAVPDSLIELHASNGVLIKPGVLILRVLLQLFQDTGLASLSVNEILNCLMSIKKNTEWEQAYTNLNRFRLNEFTVTGLQPANRRNVQDWLKFLSKTDLFDISGNQITLSRLVLDSPEIYTSICETAENPNSFWIPTDLSRETRQDWFTFFGQIPLSLQGVIPNSHVTETYVENNFIGGLDEDVGNEIYGNFTSDVPDIALVEYTETQANTNTTPPQDIDMEAAVRRLREGIFKRQLKAQLHDELVDKVADMCREKGGTVFEDRDSVDLLVRWPNQSESIFEMKTITMKSFQQRIRLAVGQIEEYSYRRYLEQGECPEKIIVIDTIVSEEAWQVDFLNNHMHTGLMCEANEEYTRFLTPCENTSSFLS